MPSRSHTSAVPSRATLPEPALELSTPREGSMPRSRLLPNQIRTGCRTQCLGTLGWVSCPTMDSDHTRLSISPSGPPAIPSHLPQSYLPSTLFRRRRESRTPGQAGLVSICRLRRTRGKDRYSSRSAGRAWPSLPPHLDQPSTHLLRFFGELTSVQSLHPTSLQGR